MSKIYVTIVRTGKQAKTQEAESGGSVRDLFVAAGFDSDNYNSWTITDEDGDRLDLGDTLSRSTTLVCGAPVDGANILHFFARSIIAGVA